MYQLENKNYDFERVTTADAIKVQSLMMMLARDKNTIDDIEATNEKLAKLALKYLTVEQDDGNWLKNIDEHALKAIFVNQYAIIEISAKFQETIKGFLMSLPTFQVGNPTANHSK